MIITAGNFSRSNRLATLGTGFRVAEVFLFLDVSESNFCKLTLHVTKIDTLFTFLHSTAQQKDSRKDICTGLVERIEHTQIF